MEVRNRTLCARTSSILVGKRELAQHERERALFFFEERQKVKACDGDIHVPYSLGPQIGVCSEGNALSKKYLNSKNFLCSDIF
jgi:hypothetical protein